MMGVSVYVDRLTVRQIAALALGSLVELDFLLRHF